MSDNWDKDLRSKGMKAKANGKCHVSFFSLERRRLVPLLNYFIFRIGPGVGVGVGVDQEPGVGVGTAPPRLRAPALNYFIARS